MRRVLSVSLLVITLSACAARTWEVAPTSPAADMQLGRGMYDDDALLLDHASPPPPGTFN